jgi:hypothetical protein
VAVPHSRSLLTACALAASFTLASPARAQQPPGSQAASVNAPAPATQASAADEDDDAVIDPAEPDFVVVNLPTTLRLPLHKGNFRLTHRFAGNLRNGTFGELAGNLFGIDQGAIIGFEYRVAVMRHVQAAFYRSSFDKTIQLYGKWDPIHQRGSMPVSISGVLSVEGPNNFQERYSPAVGLVISRTVARHVAAYVTPVWNGNSAAALTVTHQHGGEGDEPVETHVESVKRSTAYLGLGARVRVLSTLYVVGEIAPRLSGYAPGPPEYGFGIDKRVGAHVFSLTFTNSFATTFSQLARGGTENTLYLGFNLARKFF